MGLDEFEINKNFGEVVACCQEIKNRPKQQGTWITDEMRAAYFNLHRLGHAHSFECYLDDKLVGGIYGVSIGRTFAAESMFYRYPNASKAVLWILGNYLLEQEVEWIDCQIINPHLTSLGVIEISREKFIKSHSVEVKKSPLEFSAKRLQALLSSLAKSGKLKLKLLE